MVNKLQDLPFSVHPLQFLPVSEGFFVHDLHGKIALSTPELSQKHAPNVSMTNPAKELEMRYAYVAHSGLQALYRCPCIIVGFVRLAYVDGVAIVVEDRKVFFAAVSTSCICAR